MLELKEVGRAIAVLAEDKRILTKASKPSTQAERDPFRQPLTIGVCFHTAIASASVSAFGGGLKLRPSSRKEPST
jgi:hypothetical protein